MNKQFYTFMEADEEKLNKAIDTWLETIKGKEISRSAPALAGYDGNYIIAVTVTAEVND